MASQNFDLVDSRAAATVQPPLLALYVELGMHTNAEVVTDKNTQRFLLMKVCSPCFPMLPHASPCFLILSHPFPSFPIPPPWQVLRRLWAQPAAWAAMVHSAKADMAADPPTSAAGAGETEAGPSATAAPASATGYSAPVGWFGEFATTLVKENIFLLDDALGRLADVKKREAEKADEAAWRAQPRRQQAEREQRLESVRVHVAYACA